MKPTASGLLFHTPGLNWSETESPQPCPDADFMAGLPEAGARALRRMSQPVSRRLAHGLRIPGHDERLKYLCSISKKLN